MGHVVWVGGDDPSHWEGFGTIPSQVGLKADWEVTSAREEWSMDIPPSGELNCGGRDAGGGKLCLLPP